MAAGPGPPPAFRLNDPHNRFTPEEARRRGREALDAGKVGGDARRRRAGDPAGLRSSQGHVPDRARLRASLFQIHVEKILAAGPPARRRIPLYLMTSPATHDETVAFFAAHDRFGLPEDDLTIFCQGTMPAVDAQTGRSVLEAPGRLAPSPDGHGGMLAAFARAAAWTTPGAGESRNSSTSRSTTRWSRSAARSTSAITSCAGAEMTSQVIAKREPLEKVGNVVELDGRLMVIEYSDLPDDVAAQRSRGRFAGDLGGEHRRPRLRPGASSSGWRRRPSRCRSMRRIRRRPASTPRAGACSRRLPTR